ncbi:MAG: aspartate carbamoyltransferase catalytic subunit [Actinomycetota bacterium]
MKHLLSINELSRGDLEELLDLARGFAEVQTRDIPKVPALRGKTVVLAFFEDSTRTRTSFDLAARRLSADVVNFSVSSSSTAKGESLRDTVETIAAMGVDAVVVRHSSSGAPHRIAHWTDTSVVNAGDGWHQHPTQALLDCYTITERLGGLDGRKVAICGDIQHSRVARSNVEAFTALGAEVILVGPRTLLPPSLEGWPVKVEPDVDTALADVDVAYFLRIQQERLAAGAFPTVREYRARYGLTVERLDRLRPDALIMHPGPMNRGVEIDPEVADDPRCLVLDQVSAGVPVRMAVLYRLLGPGRFDPDQAP